MDTLEPLVRSIHVLEFPPTVLLFAVEMVTVRVLINVHVYLDTLAICVKNICAMELSLQIQMYAVEMVLAVV